MRLIDADALKKQVIECDLEKPEKITFRWMISQQPTIDAAPVVRCHDCALQAGCKVAQRLGDNGFCSYGEKRGDDAI